jgi:hypothetical protein
MRAAPTCGCLRICAIAQPPLRASCVTTDISLPIAHTHSYRLPRRPLAVCALHVCHLPVVRHMFRWLSGLPYSLYENANGQRGLVQTELRLADPGTQASLPAGAKWGAKIDDGTKRWVLGFGVWRPTPSPFAASEHSSAGCCTPAPRDCRTAARSLRTRLADSSANAAPRAPQRSARGRRGGRLRGAHSPHPVGQQQLSRPQSSATCSNAPDSQPESFIW